MTAVRPALPILNSLPKTHRPSAAPPSGKRCYAIASTTPLPCLRLHASYSTENAGASERDHARTFIAFLRPPDQIIGDRAHPYMLRWCLLPENRLFNIFVHCILRNDHDAALHDHPWPSVSILLKGVYREILPDFFKAPTPRVCVTDVALRARVRSPGKLIVRRAVTAHRLQIVAGPDWTLFITRPRMRTWGFHCLVSGARLHERPDRQHPGNGRR